MATQDSIEAIRVQIDDVRMRRGLSQRLECPSEGLAVARKGPDELRALDAIVLGRLARGQPRSWTYRLFALLHPTNVAAFIVVGTLALTLGSLLPLAAGALVEVLLLLTVPRLARFRRGVDRRIARLHRVEATLERERRLACLAITHQAEYRRLEHLLRSLAERRRAQLGERGSGAEQHESELAELLDLYLSLGVATAERRALQKRLDLEALEARVNEAATAVGADRSALVNGVVERQLSVIGQILQQAERLVREVVVLELQMSTICSVLELLEGEAVAPRGLSVVSEAVEQTVATLQHLESRGPSGALDDEMVEALARLEAELVVPLLLPIGDGSADTAGGSGQVRVLARSG